MTTYTYSVKCKHAVKGKYFVSNSLQFFPIVAFPPLENLLYSSLSPGGGGSTI